MESATATHLKEFALVKSSNCFSVTFESSDAVASTSCRSELAGELSWLDDMPRDGPEPNYGRPVTNCISASDLSAQLLARISMHDSPPGSGQSSPTSRGGTVAQSKSSSIVANRHFVSLKACRDSNARQFSVASVDLRSARPMLLQPPTHSPDFVECQSARTTPLTALRRSSTAPTAPAVSSGSYQSPTATASPTRRSNFVESTATPPNTPSTLKRTAALASADRQQQQHSRLVDDIVALAPDVLRVTHVGEHLSSLQSTLAAHGYAATRSTSVADMASEQALFYRSDALELVGVSSVGLHSLAVQELSRTELTPAVRAAVSDYLAYADSLLVGRFRPTAHVGDSAAGFAVASLMASGERPLDVRCNQLCLVVRELELLSETQPWLLIGGPAADVETDSPLTQILRDGYPDEATIERLQRVRDVRLPPPPPRLGEPSDMPRHASNAALIDLMWKGFQHSRPGLTPIDGCPDFWYTGGLGSYADLGCFVKSYGDARGDSPTSSVIEIIGYLAPLGGGGHCRRSSGSSSDTSSTSPPLRCVKRRKRTESGRASSSGAGYAGPAATADKVVFALR